MRHPLLVMCLILYFVHDLSIPAGIMTAVAVAGTGMAGIRLLLLSQKDTLDPFGVRLLQLCDEMIKLIKL